MNAATRAKGAVAAAATEENTKAKAAARLNKERQDIAAAKEVRLKAQEDARAKAAAARLKESEEESSRAAAVEVADDGAFGFDGLDSLGGSREWADYTPPSAGKADKARNPFGDAI